MNWSKQQDNGASERVLVISQVPPPHHGSTIMTKILLANLQDQGFTVELVDRRFSKSVSEIGNLSLRKVFSAFIMPLRLARKMWQFRPGLVILFATNRTFSFLVDVMLSSVLSAFDARQILYLHTRGFRDLARRSELMDRLVRRLFRNAERVVCLGPSLVPDIAEFVSTSRVSIIPNATEPLPSLEPPRRGHVLYLSNLIPEKGASTFVDIAGSIGKLLPKAEFVVAGASADERFQQDLILHAKREGLGDRITFLGAVTDDRVKWDLVAGASVLIFPSTYAFEAQPLTILEAMSVGVPVVAFDVGGIKDLVRDGVTGLLYPVGNVQEMGAGVARLLQNPDLRQRMSRESHDTFQAEFSIKAFSDNWSALLRNDGVRGA